MQTGCFPNKFSWKKIVREKINALYRDEMLMRITASESFSRIFKVHTKIPFHFILMYFGYFVENVHATKKYAHLAIRLIGLMFCGKWFSMCHKCSEKSISLTKHILLFCPSNNKFRNKLIARFGFDFYTKISLSASDQVNSLLSGFCDLLKLKSTVSIQ